MMNNTWLPGVLSSSHICVVAGSSGLRNYCRARDQVRSKKPMTLICENAFDGGVQRAISRLTDHESEDSHPGMACIDRFPSARIRCSTVQQGSGKYDRVLTRLDDVSDPAHPIPLYEPHDVALQSKRVTPAGLIPENGTQIAWTLSDSQLLRDKGWLVYALDIGDAERRHELRCQYEVSDRLPGPALLAGVGSLLIALLLLQVRSPWDSSLLRNPYEAACKEVGLVLFRSSGAPFRGSKA